MNCVIPGGNLKVFGKALHALCKYGYELYIEPSPNKLSLRTVSLSKTAYAICDFTVSFFSYYQLSDTYDENNDALKCKIPMKSILGIFKNTAQLEKNVVSCKVEYGHTSTKIMFKFHYKHDIIKTHYLYLIEGETLQAFYLKDDSSNKISVSNSFFPHALHNFQVQDSEISFIVSSQKLIIRNYMENEITSAKMMRTQLSIHSSDFNLYKVGVETEIRFTLQQFRAAITLADSLNLNIDMNFETSGKPIVIVIKNDVTFEANFVLSTMRYGADTQSMESTQKKSKTKEKKKQRDTLEHLNVDSNEHVIPYIPENTQSNVIQKVFKRCWDTTFNPEVLTKSDMVLAESSDPEDV